MLRLTPFASALFLLVACNSFPPDSGTAASGSGRIVFRSRDIHGSLLQASVYSINPDGSALQKLMDVPSGGGSALSPDGTRLAIGDPGAGINWFNLDSTILHHVATTEIVGVVSWTDDSRQLLFDDANGSRIGRVGADGSALQILVDGLYPSSAGGLFTYQRGGRAWFANVDGTAHSQIDTTSNTGESGPPQMAPGGRVAMIRSTPRFSSDSVPRLLGANSGLFVYDITNRSMRQLTANPPDDQPSSTLGAPVWSPDGARIVYGSAGKLFVISASANLATGVQITPESLSVSKAAAWSPHGTRVVFIANNDVYVVNADGSDLQNLINSPNTVEFGVQWAAH